MNRLLLIFALLLFSGLWASACNGPAPSGPDAIQIDINSGQPTDTDVDDDVRPAPTDRKPLLLIGLDGFRPSYLDLAPTPNFDRVVAEGVLAQAMIPMFPSKTMVNLYSIVTGLYPENSGIISNTMYDAELNAEFRMFGGALTDARWFNGEPIWVTAEQQGVRTATVFWVGSEAPIKGVRPTHWLPYNSGMSHRDRIDQVLEWLTLSDETRPDFVTLYFSRPDNTGHSHGPDSNQIRSTIQDMDDAMGYLFRKLQEFGLWDDVNLVFVSDHGMTRTGEDHLIMLDQIINLNDVRIIDWSPVAMMQPRAGRLDAVYNALKAAENNYKVYKKEDLPEHYRLKNSPRLPDIVMIADLPYTIASANYIAQNGVMAGNHGYDPREPDMHAFFLARGPGFKRGVQVDEVHVVDLYELMAHLLLLEPADNDGSLDSIAGVLAR
jgi:ectonucleotide pyrophosphatase/phosphodiesterase family member 5